MEPRFAFATHEPWRQSRCYLDRGCNHQCRDEQAPLTGTDQAPSQSIPCVRATPTPVVVEMSHPRPSIAPLECVVHVADGPPMQGQHRTEAISPSSHTRLVFVPCATPGILSQHEANSDGTQGIHELGMLSAPPKRGTGNK